MTWWVIQDTVLREALQRAAEGDDPGVVETEMFVNSVEYLIQGGDDQ